MLHRQEPTRGSFAGRMLHARRFKPDVPLNPLTASPVRLAALWLFPYLDKSPGLYGSMTALLACSVGSLRHWLHGRRNMPDRVRLILIATIEARLESGAAIVAELKAAAPGPKPNPASHFHGPKARKAKAQDDAAKDAL